MRLLPLAVLLACNPSTTIEDAPLELQERITIDNLMVHLEALQAIADANDGNRAVGTPGFTASADYAEQVFSGAGYAVQRQPFEFNQWVQYASTVVEVPGGTVFEAGVDIAAMSFSGAGDVTADVTAVDLVLPPTSTPSSTSGCEASDFTGFPEGNIALIQRGTCRFQEKIDLAMEAGASAALIFNEGQTERRDLEGWQLDSEATVTIPVASASFPTGDALAAALQDGAVPLRIAVDGETIAGIGENVLVDTPGDVSRTLVVGGHLDSVLAGPGINDNGTGVALVLELARQVAALEETPERSIRFALWGGEELGLLGSNAYVENLDEVEIGQIVAKLNFDMIGSPNGSRMIYDGDGDDFGLPGPDGSGEIELVFEDWFTGEGLASVTTIFSGRSDYLAFIRNGIPAGGLFTGAEGLKEAEEAAVFGGEAGIARDACYHRDCDTIDNIDPVLYLELARAAAFTTWELSHSDVELGRGGQRRRSAPVSIPIGDCAGHTATGW